MKIFDKYQSQGHGRQALTGKCRRCSVNRTFFDPDTLVSLLFQRIGFCPA
jgi:hypothetical protein